MPSQAELLRRLVRDRLVCPGYPHPTPGESVCAFYAAWMIHGARAGPCPLRFALRPLHRWGYLVDRRNFTYTDARLERIGTRLQVIHDNCCYVTGTRRGARINGLERAQQAMRLYVLEAAMLDCGWTLTTESVQTLIPHAWNWTAM
jgi:hypothetical protein